MMANNKAHMANGGVQYTMYKSDSEFTDQSDSSAMQSPPLPPLNQHHPVLSLRHRNVPPSSTNNCSQQHTQKALNNNNNNNNLHMPNANLMSVNNNNANRLNGGQQLLPQSFPPQHQQLMSANHCSNNNNEVSVQDQNRFRAAKRSSPGMSEMNNMANANIHPNLAEHGEFSLLFTPLFVAQSSFQTYCSKLYLFSNRSNDKLFVRCKKSVRY